MTIMKTIPVDHVIVGTCGICGGPVTLPRIWGGVNLPPKTCATCGATAKESYGPILPMSPGPGVTISGPEVNKFSM